MLSEKMLPKKRQTCSLWVLAYGGHEQMRCSMLVGLPVSRLEHGWHGGTRVALVHFRVAVSRCRMQKAVLHLYIEHCITAATCLPGADEAAMPFVSLVRGGARDEHECLACDILPVAPVPQSRCKSYVVVYGASGAVLQPDMLKGLQIKSIETTIDHQLRYAKLELHMPTWHTTVTQRWHECCAAHKLRPSHVYGYDPVCANTHAEPLSRHPCCMVIYKHRLNDNEDWTYTYLPQAKKM